MPAISLAVGSALLLIVADDWTAVRKGEWTEFAG